MVMYKGRFFNNLLIITYYPTDHELVIIFLK
jgi:hypothetical protein